MNKKYIALSVFAIIAILTTMSTAEAFTGVFQEPTTGTTQCGATNLRLKVIAGGTQNVSYCYNTTAGVGTQFAVNDTAGNNNTQAITSSTLSDGTYTFMAHLNYSYGANCSSTENVSLARITIDNTAPVVTWLTPSAGATIGKNYNFSITLDENTKACTLYFGKGATPYTMTNTGNDSACYYEFAVDKPPEGIYPYYVIVTDNTTCTNSRTDSTREVRVDNGEGNEITETIGAIATSEETPAGAVGAFDKFMRAIKNFFAKLCFWC